MKILILHLFLLGACVDPSGAKNKGEIVTTMGDQVATKFKGVKHVDAKTARDLVEKEGFFLVDVRSEKERAVSKIAGAITLDEFNAMKSLGKRAITYCTLGGRSSKAVKELTQNGFEALSLKGGVLAWAHAGENFERLGKMIKKVHVFSEAYNLLPKGFEAVYD